MVVQKLLNYKIFCCNFVSIISMVVLSSCTVGQGNIKTKDISVDNIIKECIEVIPIDLIKKDKSVYINAELKTKKAAGYCGCKSALLTYKVVSKKENSKTTLSYNVFSPLNKNSYDFLVCDDLKNDYKSLTLYIDCKNPD